MRSSYNLYMSRYCSIDFQYIEFIISIISLYCNHYILFCRDLGIGWKGACRQSFFRMTILKDSVIYSFMWYVLEHLAICKVSKGGLEHWEYLKALLSIRRHCTVSRGIVKYLEVFLSSRIVF